MFWRDPNLYGATFPYKDVSAQVQNPWMGFPAWGNTPRFMPPIHTPQFNLPQLSFPQQFNLPQTVNPYLYPQAISPFVQMPYTPFTPYTPYTQMFDVNFYRPFIG